MSQQVEQKAPPRRRRLARLPWGRLFFACFLVCVPQSLAEDGDEPPATPVLSAASVKRPPLVNVDDEQTQSHPFISGFLKLLEKVETGDDERAAVVEIDLLPKAQGPWTTTPEEAGPKSATRAAIIRPDDPEFIRSAALKEDSSPDAPLPKSHSTGIARTPNARTPGQTHPATSSLRDAPRFISGDGLDSDAAEIVAALALAEQEAPKSALEAAALETPDEKTPAERAKKEDVPASAVKSPEDAATAELIAKLGGIKPGAAGKTKTKKGKGPAESEDPEKRFQDLIAQIDKNKKMLAAMSKARDEKSTDALPEGERERIKDPRSHMILEALRGNTPTATVTGTITDGTGRQTMSGRVRILDATDSAVAAPLSEGFWSTGNFSATVISGPVKIEAWRGRFAPPYLHGINVKPRATVHIDIPLNRPASHLFATRGWHLADLDMGLRLQPGERSMWLGEPPQLADLLLAARAEGVQILGVPIPFSNPESAKAIQAYKPENAGSVLVLPVFPGPRHPFHGSAMGLGIKSWGKMPVETGLPEQPLYEAFEEIRARGGLAVIKDLTGLKTVDLRRDVLSMLPRLEQSHYFARTSGKLRLYSANELPFATVIGPSYDVIAFDGSDAAVRLWFNLLNKDYSVAIIGAGGGSLEGGRLPYGQTFIQFDGGLTRESVMEAIKQGHTSVSFGPAAFCKIVERDKGPGSVLPADGRQLTLQIQAYASLAHGTQLEKIEIIRNGEVVHTQQASEGESSVHNLSWPISETASAWYIVRVTERKNIGNAMQSGGSAWTSPIYFRNAAYAEPAPVVSKVSGTLRKGLTPVQGTVTAVVAGQPPQQVATDTGGAFSITLPASGSLIFSADGCEPVAHRIFEHPSIQRAMGALIGEQRGTLAEQFGNPALLPTWKLLLSELHWDITVSPKVRVTPDAENADTILQPKRSIKK